MSSSFWWLMLCAIACAHGPQRGNADGLKPAADMFFKRARWRDYRGATEVIVPERRAGFDRARAKLNDETNLEITDYDLQDMRMATDGRKGVVICRLSWLRLPSVTESTATVTNEFIFRDGTWFLVRQDAGPFAEELSEPYTEPSVDAGIAAR